MNTPAPASLLALMNDRQTRRLMRLSFPHNDGPDALLLVNRLDAAEALSRDFRFTVQLLSDDARIELKHLQGKMLTVELVREDGSLRYFNGYVFEFRLTGTDGGQACYEAVVLPWLAYLRLRRDNYLFHYHNLAEQTEAIFSDYPVRDSQLRISGPDPVMTDACQFGESDYNYLHRRWEAAGWYYWYEHRADGHSLILSNDSTQAPAIDGEQPGIPYQDQAGSLDDDAIASWSPVRRLVPASVALSSFDFKQPRPQHSDTPTNNRQGDVLAQEVYEYSGGYGFKNSSDGDDQSRLRMEAIEATGKCFEARGNDRTAQPGRWFQLTGHYEAQDSGYLITEVRHQISNNYQSRYNEGASYQNRLTCLRKTIPWRPGRGYNSSEPKIFGLQTALVVGPPGEEIHTDEYGRVRVQFHWDRKGRHNDQSSAWIRVATPWSGNQFGMTAIPRIGSEVIVQFLDGNPDRPLITGMVPNAATLPPWSLPANKTQSGILSRSTPGGAYDNANAIRFEDKKGQEQLWLHAEKDQLTEVEHDESKWVGHDRSKTIDHDETSHIRHNRTETVGNDENITVHNHRTERVDHNETISIGDHRDETVGQNETIRIGQNRTETVVGNESITVQKNRSRKVGQNEILSISNNRDKTVGSSETDQIAKSWSVQVGKMKTETVGMASIDNVGLAKMSNIGVAYSLLVGMLRNTVVGMTDRLNVGKSRSVSVGDTQEVHIGKTETRTVGKTQINSVGEHLELVCGAAKIVLRSDGSIYLQGSHIEIQGSAQINADAAIVQINCGASKSPPPAPPKEADAASSANESATDASAGAAEVVPEPNLSTLLEGGRNAVNTLNQLKGMAQTLQAAKHGDTGAVASIATGIGGAVSTLQATSQHEVSATQNQTKH